MAGGASRRPPSAWERGTLLPAKPVPRRRGAATRTVSGDRPNPRTQAARIGGRRPRWDAAWHADHAHPHRSRQGQHARSPPLSRVALMEGHLEVGGYRTWYRVVGDLDASAPQAPVILCHGGPGATHDYIAPIADQLAATGRTSVLYDQLGNGRSDHLPDADPSFWTVD